MYQNRGVFNKMVSKGTKILIGSVATGGIVLSVTLALFYYLHNENIKEIEKSSESISSSLVASKESSSSSSSSSEVVEKYLQQARDSVGGRERVTDEAKLERDLKDIKVGFQRAMKGDVSPNTAKNFYFRPTSFNDFFYLTYMPEAYIDDFIEIYGEGADERQIFRLYWHDNYYYFVGSIVDGQMKIEGKFGNFPEYYSGTLNPKEDN